LDLILKLKKRKRKPKRRKKKLSSKKVIRVCSRDKMKLRCGKQVEGFIENLCLQSRLLYQSKPKPTSPL
jgi:hypothetical protein